MALRPERVGRLGVNFWSGPILALETSCDETAAAVLAGRSILSNVIASQVEMHAKWGGVVPEAAARAHVESIVPVIAEALAVAGVDRPSAIAVTNRPGLVGALSVGVSAAKALALVHDIPLIGVHHLEGHILSPLAASDLIFPHVSLVVSGGHTELVLVESPGRYRMLGETLDDAAGEAFDKGARLLGLGYPGGFAVQQAAESGDPLRYPLPRAVRISPFDFSFSGLKTAMLRLVAKEGPGISVPDAAASLQAAIIDVLVAKSLDACESVGVKALSLVGGVSANRPLRESLAVECRKRDYEFAVPPPGLSTDNAAMIGLAGSIRLAEGERDSWGMEVTPVAELPGLVE